MHGMGTIDEFAQLIVKSGLLDESSMVEVRNNSFGPSASEFGDYLVAHKHLTRWQCDHLLNGRSKGFFIDHYKLLQLHASDRNGLRYVAENLRLRKLVILSFKPPSRDYTAEDLLPDLDDN